MKRLLVLRHAKSSWKGSLRDFDRPLNARGVREAELMGQFIATSSLRPEGIISSPALRARSTAELFVSSTGLNIPMAFEPGIYDASLSQLLNIVSEFDDAKATLLMVGHNPGIEQLLKFVCDGVHHVPTASLGSIVIESDKWQAIKLSEARLEWLRTPEQLDTIAPI